MKPQNLLVALSILVTLLVSTTSGDHPFDKVIANQTNDSVKTKLRTFRDGGIERALEYEALNDDSIEENPSPKIDLERIIATAQGFLGTKHEMSGTCKSGIDCSGLVMMSVKSTGITLPHNSHEQARYGKIIPDMDSLKRGDLVFFINSFKSEYFITHSGIYLGNKKFIHASASKGVITTPITDVYWKSKFIFGTRLKI
jgi:cell wall-associated NlpC family hydrolase